MGGLECGGEPGQGQGGQQQAEVAQGDVVVVAEQQQVADDAGQPGGDQVAADLGPDGHDQPGDDLDDADGQHRARGAAGDQAVDGRCQVGGPVGQQVGELVQAEQDRGDDEPGPQDQVGLVGGVARGRTCGREGGAVTVAMGFLLYQESFFVIDVPETGCQESFVLEWRHGPF